MKAWLKKAYKRYIIDALSAMGMGLFASLIIGLILSQLSAIPLLGFLKRRFAPRGVAVRTQEDLGWSSDAKEAVAFALLADCCVRERPNTLPSVTGAREAAIMGKLSLPAGREATCI